MGQQYLTFDVLTSNKKNEGTVLPQIACPYLFHQVWDLSRRANLWLVLISDITPAEVSKIYSLPKFKISGRN